MSHATRLLFGAAVVMIGGAVLAQPKGGAPADNYLPAKKDSKWTYKVGDNKIEVRVSKVDKVGGEEQFQFDTVVGTEAKTSETMLVRADGVYRSKVKDDKLDPYIKLLPLPVKKGATWDINSKLGTQTIKGTLKVIDDAEKIEVQGVKFTAVQVEGKDMDVAGAKTTVRIWFAKDVGIVKQEFVLATGDKVLLELAKDGYVPGK
jgi:hypothetical protein